MTETLGIVADQTYETIITYENNDDAIEHSPGSQEEEPWGTDLMNYVMANQYVIVRCSWMGGAKVTLGEAMMTYSYPPNMTEKDVPAVMAVVDELLANRVEEEGEAEEEKTEEDEHGEETEDKESKWASVRAEKAMRKNKVETETQKDKAKSAIKVERPSQKESDTVEPLERVKPNDIQAVEAQVPRAVSPKIEQSAPKAAGIEVLAGPKIASLADIEVQHDIRNTKPATDEGPNFFVSPQVEPLVYAELTKLETESLKKTDFLENPVENPAATPLVKESLGFSNFNYELGEDDLAEFDSQEIEIIVNHHEEDVFRDDERLDSSQIEASNLDQGLEEVIGLVDDKENTPEPTEIFLAEHLARIELPLEEIEASLLQVAEKIESSPPETIKTIDETLARIAELSDKLEDDSGEEISEPKAQEDLEELFTKLFERLGIDYTPELIETLAQLTMKYYLGEKIQELKEKEDVDAVPHDRGTHEIIKRLLVALSKVKKIMTNAYTIGKSALRLYRYDFPVELKKRLAAA